MGSNYRSIAITYLSVVIGVMVIISILGFNPDANAQSTIYSSVNKWGSLCILNGGYGCKDPDGTGPLSIGDGQFDVPIGTVVDSSRNVYVADTNNDRIQKFKLENPCPAGTQQIGVCFVKKWGSFGKGDGQLKHPNSVAVDSSGNVYVTDIHNHRIQKFQSDGDFIRKWGPHHCKIATGQDCTDPDGTGPLSVGDGQFFNPGGIEVDSSHKVYVVDSDNNRIQKFTNTGDFIQKWGSYGSGYNELTRPNGIDISPQSGHVFVADPFNNRIQEFGIIWLIPLFWPF